ncbi:MAG: C10 family peptidase [Bacteroidales bacterium]|nr:C10 family peptidase [Bacteroidales bacterium]
MKKAFLLVLLCCLFTFVFADNVVSVQEAKTASKNFISATYPDKQVTTADFILKHTEYNEDNEPLYYVFTIRGGGFIIVSASDAVSPVLAYSLDSEYDGTVANYALNVYKNSIAAAKGTENAAAAKEWNFYKNFQPTNTRETYVSQEVKPLINSTWNQTKYYNNYCPIYSDATQYQHNTDCDHHVPAGCVAADMAVLMHFYRYPDFGELGVAYHPIHYELNDDNEITDTVEFPWQVQSFNTLHDYNLMPNEDLNFYNGEVAQLMWHAGMSVLMDYGPSSSGAVSEDALEALKNNWGYNRTAQQLKRSDYSNSVSWIKEIHNELDSLRPLYYSARDSRGGHAFILDGYRDVNNITTTPVYSDTIYTLDHVDTTFSYTYDIDTIQVDSVTVIYDTTATYVEIVNIDSVYNISHSDTSYVVDTTFSHTLFHVNWGWGGYNNGYFQLSGTGYLDGYREAEAAFVGLYPAGNPAKLTEGDVRVVGTSGSISDGAGHLAYLPNTDRTWTISAPEATRYTIKFKKLDTEANGDYVIFYKNGNMNQEEARYSGQTLPSAFNINADSITIRFVSNSNDQVGMGFVLDFSVTVPAQYCDAQTVLTGSGIITDKGNANVDQNTPYRPETNCVWKINGASKVYFSYPQIELGEGDFIDFFDVTNPNPNKAVLLKRIDQYNWPDEDVFVCRAPKIQIRFISDNFDEDNGFTLTYEIVTDIDENNTLNQVSVYPNPACNVLNVDVISDTESQLNFRICDMTGRTLSLESVENLDGELHHSINVSNLSKGMYMLSIEGKQGKQVQKFIVE